MTRITTRAQREAMENVASEIEHNLPYRTDALEGFTRDRDNPGHFYVESQDYPEAQGFVNIYTNASIDTRHGSATMTVTVSVEYGGTGGVINRNRIIESREIETWGELLGLMGNLDTYREEIRETVEEYAPEACCEVGFWEDEFRRREAEAEAEAEA